MKTLHRLFSVSLLALTLVTALGQTATDSNEGSRLEYDKDNQIFRFKWWARSGRVYFVQSSQDLMQPWSFVPIIEVGDDSIKEWGFTSTSDKFFVRLRYVEETTEEPISGDYDDDGISNLDEVNQGTDPFNYYSQTTSALIVPILTRVSGDGQAGYANTFAGQSLLVKITDSQTGLPLENATVVFTVTQGNGKIALINTGAPQLTSRETVNTDASGYAWVYYEFSGNSAETQQVTATAGTGVPVVFTLAGTPADIIVSPESEGYSTVQSALNAVTNDNQVIVLTPGTYYEPSLVFPANHKVTIRSTGGSAVTIIDAQKLSGGPSISTDTTLSGLTFQNATTTTNGGGLRITGGNTTLANCVIRNNESGESGSAVYTSGHVVMINCTIYENYAGSSGATLQTSNGTIGLLNTIVWNGGNETALDATTGTVSITASYSNVQGSSVYSGQGNINSDPLLRGDGHIAASSPCVDVGTATGAPATDMDMEARPVGAGVDIGADEYRDTNGNGIPDWWELKYFGKLQIGINSMAVNGSGKTLLECYQDEIDPTLAPQEEPFTIAISATGTYREPANVPVICRITKPAKSTITRVDYYENGAFQTSITAPPYHIEYPAATAKTYYIEAIAYESTGRTAYAKTEFKVEPSNRYQRGWGVDTALLSSVIAIDFQKGMALDGKNNNTFAALFPNGYPWFLRTRMGTNQSGQSIEPWQYIATTTASGATYNSCNYVPYVNSVQVGGQPPLVAFGSKGGGTALYTGRAYTFGVAAGGQLPSATTNPDIKIEVYQKSSFNGTSSNVSPVHTATFTLPRVADSTRWATFANNGYVESLPILVTLSGTLSGTIDLDTQVQYLTYQQGFLSSGMAVYGWGQVKQYPLVVTHRAGNSDFYYKVSYMGYTYATDKVTAVPMAKDVSGFAAYNLTYALDFDDASSVQSSFLNQPHFQGTPLPSSYQGKSVDELIHNAAKVTDTLTAPGATGLDLLSVNNSPELKSHSALDKLAADLGDDPMALANYVLNEIELTDAIGYNVGGVSEQSINPQGVCRDALAVYLEGKGSPAEQCALLIYLLRQKGISCGYVFPAHNDMQMFDQQMSKLLKMQIRGAANTFASNNSYSYQVPVTVPVNYPWVAAYIGGKWVHIFPWIKDTSVTEGVDLWNYMPEGYRTGSQFVRKYILNDSALRNDSYISSRTDEDNLGSIFELFVQKQVESKGLSIDQVGMNIYNRRNYYTRWEDFPRPWATSSVSNSNLAQSLSESQNPHLASTLNEIFDTVSIEIISDRNGNSQADSGEPILNTGTLRMVDLHDRRLLLYHQVIQNTTPTQYKLVLSLEPYDALNTNTTSYTFSGGSTFDGASSPAPTSDLLRHRQAINATLFSTTDPNTNDDVLLYKVTYVRHGQAQSISITDWDAFLGLHEKNSISDTLKLRKGDMAALCYNYGQVSQKMLEFQAQKYWRYQQTLTSGSSSAADPEQSMGQILYLMGQSYYSRISKFNDRIEDLAKIRSVTRLAYGLSKFSPERTTNDTPNLITTTISGTQYTDIDLRYPRVDMKEARGTWVGNGTTHLDSGDDGQSVVMGVDLLMITNSSCEEHRVLNQFFSNSAAISTIRLLDIAQGWTEATRVAANPGVGPVVLTAANYQTQGGVSYPGVLSSNTNSTVYHSLSYWATQSGLWTEVLNAFTTSNPLASMTTIIMTPGPVFAAGQQGQSFNGMAAMVMSPGKYGALISDGRVITNGGYAGSVGYSVPSSNLSQSFVYDVTLYPKYDAGFSVVNTSQYTSSQPAYTQEVSISNYAPISSAIENSAMYIASDSQARLSAYNSLISLTVSSPVANTGAATLLTLEQSLVTGIITTNPVSYGEMFEFTQAPTYSEAELANSRIPINVLQQAVFDPVNALTGEFYVNTLDIKLHGPMPLEIRRVYGSQNLADNNFGSGWRLSYFPYLQLSTATDSGNIPTVIYAAEEDGSVIAYQHQSSPTTRWIPTATYNPTLANVTNGATGGSANPFNNRIDSSIESGDTIYTLTGANGSVRVFKTLTFSAPTADGVTRVRPYLQTWMDHSGNTYTFSYGLSQSSTDYGQLNRIQSTNGDFLGLNYDTNGHIVEAFAGDGRRLTYKYDTYGDLVQVTLPDASTIQYGYQHLSTSSNSATTTYSTHLITQEIKPGGRILQNFYDANRRVLVQKSSSGSNSSLIASATFSYNISPTDTLSGFTNITDARGKITTYTYSGGQITSVRDPMGQITSQTWHTSTSSGGFPRSLASTTDKRGLTTSYQYDSAGNVIQITRMGNLTGQGSSSETATTTISYNTATVTLPFGGIKVMPNVIANISDPLNNSTVYRYDDSSHPLLPTTISKVCPSGVVSKSVRQYTNVTGESGKAYGLLQKETVASGTTDRAITAYTWNGHGFLTSKTIYTGTDDPNVTATYSYNLRGELTSETDAAGRTSRYSYDARGNRAGLERYDEWGTIVSWNYVYYNQNGEPEWMQGSRYSPVDYTYKQYDGAGRLTQELKATSAALLAGVGVTDTGFTALFYYYDDIGNLIESVDGNKNSTTITYDDIGQIIGKSVHNGSKTGTVLAMESFSYSYAQAPLTTTHTTPLGGVEVTSYTSTGQVKNLKMADGSTKSYQYDLGGRVIRETLNNGSYWTTQYDDFNRTVTRRFYNSSDVQQGVENQILDRRGNVISKTDLGSNTFTTTYDGLNRIKKSTGPATSGNSAQQQTLYTYDASGLQTIVTNAAGEKSITYKDALGRPTLVSVFNSNGSTASNTGYWYSPDHNSVVKTVGSGNNAITTTEYSDTMGRTVMLKHADGTYQINIFDANGNRINTIGEAVDGVASVTNWTYDALNRLVTTTLPHSSSTDAAVITNTYTLSNTLSDALVVTQAMPGGTSTKTIYDPAGRKKSEQLLGNAGDSTRTYTYSYYDSSSTFKGMLQSIIDPRGFTSTTSYDAWLRPTSVVSTGGSIDEQRQNTHFEYDLRGMPTTITQSYAVAATGPGTIVKRHFDSYGQLDSESIMLTTATNSTTLSQWAQGWNNTGHRSSLNFGLSTMGNGTGTQYAYAYNALGLLTEIGHAGTSYYYGYNDNGLLQYRYSNWHTQYISQRDNRGRVTAQESYVLGNGMLLESMDYRGDSRLSNHTVSGIIFSYNGFASETRHYGYDRRGRVTQEPFLLRYPMQVATPSLAIGQQTSGYYFDEVSLASPSTLGGLGVRTLQYINGDTYNVVNTQDNFKRSSLSTVGANSYIAPNLQYYDAAGNVTSQVLQTTTFSRSYTWDSFGRLVKISKRFGSGDFDTRHIYDGLGRRLLTINQNVVNGNPSGNPSTVTYHYDPLVEFLELGINDNGDRNWKVYGPDRSGVYGRLQGCGGLESTINETYSFATIPMSNYLGDVLGIIHVPSLTSFDGLTYDKYVWLTFGAYGTMPGTYFTNALTPQWRGRYTDYGSELVYMGARYYDPNLGRFISPDPKGHASSLSLYDYANGDPVNGLDPDGRCAESIKNFYDTKIAEPTYSNKVLSSLSITDPYGGDGIIFDYTLEHKIAATPPSPERLSLLQERFGSLANVPQSVLDQYSVPGFEKAQAFASGFDRATPYVEAGAWFLVQPESVVLTGLKETSALAKVAQAAESEVTVYRVFGGDARAQGFSWTTTHPESVSNFRNLAGLPSGGASGATNTAEFMIQGKVNVRDILKSRSALPLDGNAGGLPELIIDPKNVRIMDFSVLKP